MRHWVSETEEWAPLYIKPKPVYDDGSAIGIKGKMALNINWLSPFIYGVIIGFGICLIIF